MDHPDVPADHSVPADSTGGLSRRTVVKTAAWAVPAIVLLKAVPAAAASGLGTITVVSAVKEDLGPPGTLYTATFTLSQAGPPLLASYFTLGTSGSPSITTMEYTDAPSNTAFTFAFESHAQDFETVAIDIPGFYPLAEVTYIWP